VGERLDQEGGKVTGIFVSEKERREAGFSQEALFAGCPEEEREKKRRRKLGLENGKTGA